MRTPNNESDARPKDAAYSAIKAIVIDEEYMPNGDVKSAKLFEILLTLSMTRLP